jgi:hypothetical protein
MHRELRPDETELWGQWLDTGNRIEDDEIGSRIRWLAAERLEWVAEGGSRWETLYRDPRDGRLWELTHPNSHLHRGGPPRLAVVSPEEAAARYGARPG